MKNLSPKVDESLTIFQEECAEVIQIISKIKRWGFASVHPDNPDGPNNREILIQEIGDVLALIAVVQKELDIGDGVLSDAIENKMERLQKFSSLIDE